MKPLLAIPRTMRPILTRNSRKSLRHNSGKRIPISPDATICEFGSICEVLGSVKDLAGNGKHAASETCQMLLFGVESWR
jgi:hypothetical protein